MGSLTTLFFIFKNFFSMKINIFSPSHRLTVSLVMIAFSLIFSRKTVKAQTSTDFCGTVATQSVIDAQSGFWTNTTSSTHQLTSYVIPVVVHIVHDGGSSNISNQQVFDAIQELNDGFSGVFGGTNANIRFELVKTDPNGCQTSGINRILLSPYICTAAPSQSGFHPSSLVSWDTDKYLNIWVVACIDGFLYGFAQFPNTGSPITDGVVIDYSEFGPSGVWAPKVIVHEVGHYLNLFHTWGLDDMPNTFCHDNSQNLFLGDRIEDTPPQLRYSGQCGKVYNTCSLDSPDLNDDVSNFMGYHKCITHFTPKQIVRMKDCIDFLRPGLSNFTNLDCTGVQSLFPKHVEIINFTSWQTTNLPNGGEITIEKLVVKSGALLEIGSGVIVHFRKGCTSGSNLIVEPGGTLVLQGKLTNSNCSSTDFWQGVEVAGANQSFAAGELLTETGSVIENAHTGIRNWATVKASHSNAFTSYGGNIYCSGTLFQNNHVGVSFFTPDKWAQGSFGTFFTNSSLENCKFLNDGFYLKSLPDFHCFVSITNVKQITITNPEFRNENNTAGQWIKSGLGISALSGGFALQGNNSDEFIGLWRGIECSKMIENRPFSIKSCNFDACNIGILNDGVSGSSILFNKFNLGDRPNFQADPPYQDQIGVYLVGNMSVIIEENEFKDNWKGVFDIENTTGICANNIGALNNIVRRNKFIDVNMGNVANNVNFAGSSGLRYECNTNTGVREYDFAITNGGIRSLQNAQTGNPNQSTGNTFTYDKPPFEDDIKNNDSNLTYIYQNVSPEVPLETTPSTVIIQQGLVNPCTQTFTSPDREDEFWLGQVRDSIKQVFLALRTDFQSRLDNGQTQNLTETVQTATPSNFGTVGNQLQAVSPWLSTVVFSEIIKKPQVFQPTFIYNLLLDNPDVLRDALFFNKIEAAVLFNNQQLQTLRNAAAIPTARTAVEENLLNQKSQFDYFSARWLAVRLPGRDDFSTEEYIGWMHDFGDYQSGILAVEELLVHQDHLAALSMLDEMAVDYYLEGEALLVHENYRALLQLIGNVWQGERSVFELNESELASIEAIESSTSGFAERLAGMLLEANGIRNYEVVPCSLPTRLLALKPTALTNTQGHPKNGQTVICFPNPTNGLVQFDVSGLNIEKLTLTLQITDALGKNLLQKEFESNKAKTTIDGRDWKSGIYFYRITDFQGIDISGKFIHN